MIILVIIMIIMVVRAIRPIRVMKDVAITAISVERREIAAVMEMVMGPMRKIMRRVKRIVGHVRGLPGCSGDVRGPETWSKKVFFCALRAWIALERVLTMALVTAAAELLKVAAVAAAAVVTVTLC